MIYSYRTRDSSIHFLQAMQKYPEVQWWWYAGLLLLAFFAGPTSISISYTYQYSNLIDPVHPPYH